MRHLSRRLQILLSKEDHELLESLSRKEKKPVAELIRRAIASLYHPSSSLQNLEALNRISISSLLQAFQWEKSYIEHLSIASKCKKKKPSLDSHVMSNEKEPHLWEDDLYKANAPVPIYLEEWTLLLLVSTHPSRLDIKHSLKKLLQKRCVLCTSSVALERSLKYIRCFADDSSELSSTPKVFLTEIQCLCSEILQATPEILERAILIEESMNLDPESSLHLAMMHKKGIRKMIGPRLLFGDLTGIDLLPIP